MMRSLSWPVTPFKSVKPKSVLKRAVLKEYNLAQRKTLSGMDIVSSGT